jgi:nitrite reductase (NADH) large subunit
MRLVIVGNGVAGITTARGVVERDPSAEVVVYSAEPFPYYPRPRLIDLLAGQVTPEQMPFYPESWYQERKIQTFLGQRVTKVLPAEHRLLLGDGSSVIYDQLVLATGARAWVPPIPGCTLGGVYTLRTLHDALALREGIRRSRHAVVLGGGLLGLDTAGALRANGIGVTVVELLPRLLPRQLDEEGAGLLQRLIEARGIEVITGDSCAAIEGADHVQAVRLRSDRVIATDMVVISAGVRSNVDLAQEAGLACGRGIVVDARLRTSDPDIYAVGDAAEFNGVVWGIIPAALAQAQVAAAQITGDSQATYQDIVPSTTLKVTGIDVTSVGEAIAKGDGLVEVRHVDPAAGVYHKLALRDGRVVGAIVIGDRSKVRLVNQLIAQKSDVSAHVEAWRRHGLDLSALQVAANREMRAR